MNVFLLDGTYELFRHFYVVPPSQDADGQEISAVRGVLGSVLSMLENDVTHIGVATDHVIESFRNELWAGYKTAEGIDLTLLSQFRPLEDALAAMGVIVWPMVEFEADDGLASAAAKAASEPQVEQVFICTPDKDLAQCVTGNRVIQFDRRAGTLCDAAGVEAKFGVPPESIPDYLALVGDASDGYPGLPGWGVKSAAVVLARYGHLETIPDDAGSWNVNIRNAGKLATVLGEQHERALLFRDIATLRTTAPVFESIDKLRWSGPRPDFFDVCARLNAGGLFKRTQAATRQRGRGTAGDKSSTARGGRLPSRA